MFGSWGRSPDAGESAVAELVEQRYAVRLGPDADRAGAGDMIVFHLDVRLAVEWHAELLAGELHSQRMPGVARNRRIDVLERSATAVLRIVQRHVVLQRVGARNVVVVSVLPAPHQSTGLVLFAG